MRLGLSVLAASCGPTGSFLYHVAAGVVALAIGVAAREVLEALAAWLRRKERPA